MPCSWYIVALAVLGGVTLAANAILAIYVAAHIYDLWGGSGG